MSYKVFLYYKSTLALLFIWLSIHIPATAQELYPLHEPASTLGKNTLGVRVFNETYKEVYQWRNMSAFRLMYGITPKLTTYVTTIFSNHHGIRFPTDYPFHNTPERGELYPFKLNGVHLYAKYRLLTIDKKNEHLRMALYADGTYVETSHHESEPNLVMGDTKGVGGGLITTYLYKKLAASLTLGYIHPLPHTGVTPDFYDQSIEYNVKTTYGQSVLYALSVGYLLYPKKYTSYQQTNINVYLELHGKAFSDATLTMMHNTPLEYILDRARYPEALRAGSFLDISPGVQAIINSNLRIDFSTTLPFLGKSWARFYPVYTLGIQYYFYL